MIAQPLCAFVNRRLDQAVARAGNIRVFGRAVHPYVLLLNLAVLVALVVCGSSPGLMSRLSMGPLVVSFLGTYLLYEGLYLRAKAALTGVNSRSLLLDLAVFFLPVYLILASLLGISIGAAVDALALMLPAMVAVVRVGCFLGGCCYGRPCALGVQYVSLATGSGCQKFRPGQVPASRVFPVQLLESAGNVLVLAVLLQLAAEHAGTGRVFAGYAIGYGLIRFTVDFWRASSVLRRVGTLSMGQVMAASLTLAGTTLLIAVS